MKVSIIIPVFNVEQYIERCIDSVMNQTYNGELECILIDDCTLDSSCDVIEHMLSSYKGNVDFIFLHHKQNKGQAAARNTGLDVATGDYVFFLDSDDYITTDCIEELVNYVNKYHNVDIVQGHRTYIVNGEFLDQEYNIKTPEYICDRKTIIRNILFSTNPGQFKVEVWNKLIRKSLLKNNKIRFTEGIIFEEPYFNLQISKFIKSICFCSKSTLFYISNREDSTMNTVHSKQNNKERHSKLTNLKGTSIN